MNRAILRKLLAIVISVLAMTSPAAGTVFVSQGGDDSNSGNSWAAAKRTIAAAVAVGEATIWVAEGRYEGPFNIAEVRHLYGGFAGVENSLEERLIQKHETVLDGRGRGTVVTLQDGGTVDGFTIKKGKGTEGGGLASFGGPVTIRNNHIVHNTASRAGGGMFIKRTSSYLERDDVTGNYLAFNRVSGPHGVSLVTGGGAHVGDLRGPFDSNIVEHNEVLGSALAQGGGLYTSSSRYGSFARNIIRHNMVSGDDATCGGGGIWAYESYSPIVANLVVHNTVVTPVGGSAAGIAAYASDALSGPNKILQNTIFGNRTLSPTPESAAGLAVTGLFLVQDNIVCANSSGVSQYSPQGRIPAFRSNCVFGNKDRDYVGISPGARDVNQDPRLRDPEAGDFRLSCFSPCVDAGTGEAYADLSGVERPVGAGVDIGAYELAPEPQRQITLTVVGGSGSGVYAAPAQIAIAADAPQPGYEFQRWVGDTTAVLDPLAPVTVVCSFENVQVEAVYRQRQDWHVRPDGDDTADGSSWETALRSLSAAAQGARPGETVRVASGEFAENALFLGVNLHGGYRQEGGQWIQDPDAPSILQAPDDTVPAIHLQSGGSVSGFSIVGGSYGILAEGPEPAGIRDNIVRGSRNAGIAHLAAGGEVRNNSISETGTGIDLAPAGSAVVTVVGNCVTACDWSGIAAADCGGEVSGNVVRSCVGDGISLRHCQSLVLRGNTSEDNFGAGLLITGGSVQVHANRLCANSDGGVRVLPAADKSGAEVVLASNVVGGNNMGGLAIEDAEADIWNNTLAGNSGMAIRYGDSTLTVHNNIIAFNHWGISGVGAAKSGNCIFGNSMEDFHEPGASLGPEDFAADPLLVSVEYGDYHILPGSPCRDGGEDPAGLMELDIDGQDRVQGAAVDVGADESFGELRKFSPRVVHVDAVAGGPKGDGTWWGSAYGSLDEAVLDVYANGPAHVWLAEGTYASALRFPPFCRLEGGFDGSEADGPAADPREHEAVLAPAPDTPWVLEVSPSITLSGVTVRGGEKSINAYCADPVLERCLLENAEEVALKAHRGSPTLSNTVIRGAPNGVACDYEGSATINGCLIIPPAGQEGGNVAVQTINWWPIFSKDRTAPLPIIANTLIPGNWVYSIENLGSSYTYPVYQVLAATRASGVAGITTYGTFSTDFPNAATGDYRPVSTYRWLDAALEGVPGQLQADYHGQPRKIYTGIDIGPAEWESTASITDLKLADPATEWGNVDFIGVVTRIFSDGVVYVQRYPQPTSGRLDMPGAYPSALPVVPSVPTPLAPGDVVLVKGRIELVYSKPRVTGTFLKLGVTEARPLVMSNADLGGGPFGVVPGASVKKPDGTWEMMTTLNNWGLLVQTYGRVFTLPGAGPFWIDDGVKRGDFSVIPGLRVVPEHSIQPPPIGSYVRVTGICDFYRSGGRWVAWLLVTRPEDIEVLEEP